MFTIPENDINKIVWLDDTKAIDKVDIEKLQN